MIEIRCEQPEDIEAIQVLNHRAFGGPTEASIVDAIRAVCPEVMSLVAVDEGQIVGHIFFSPVSVFGESGTIEGMGLGPMAVLPEFQRQGIGLALIQAGIKLVRQKNHPFVIVLGHPEYYPRFGFVPASRYGLAPQWEGIPDEAFMVLLLDETAKADLSGIARYLDEFDQAI
jgi:putative acetyltransferase